MCVKCLDQIRELAGIIIREKKWLDNLAEYLDKNPDALKVSMKTKLAKSVFDRSDFLQTEIEKNFPLKFTDEEKNFIQGIDKLGHSC